MVPPSCRPQSDADAYQIQDAVTSELGEAIGGWKVGAASATAAAYCAPIYATMIRQSPASYNAAELRLIGIEAEIAFRLARDLPARAAAYDRAQVTVGHCFTGSSKSSIRATQTSARSTGLRSSPTISLTAVSSTDLPSRIGGRSTSAAPRSR